MGNHCQKLVQFESHWNYHMFDQENSIGTLDNLSVRYSDTSNFYIQKG